MEEQITQFLINLSPALVALFGVVVTVIQGVKQVKATTDELKSDANIKCLVNENKQLQKNNEELAQGIRELSVEVRKLKETVGNKVV